MALFTLSYTWFTYLLHCSYGFLLPIECKPGEGRGCCLFGSLMFPSIQQSAGLSQVLSKSMYRDHAPCKGGFCRSDSRVCNHWMNTAHHPLPCPSRNFHQGLVLFLGLPLLHWISLCRFWVRMTMFAPVSTVLAKRKPSSSHTPLSYPPYCLMPVKFCLRLPFQWKFMLRDFLNHLRWLSLFKEGYSEISPTDVSWWFQPWSSHSFLVCHWV